jgi:ABC-2 type transport system permease protein
MKQEAGSTMLRILALWRKEWTQLLRNRLLLIVFFSAVTFQLVLFGYAVNSRIRQVPLVYTDQDRTETSRRFLLFLRSGGYFRVQEEADGERGLKEALNRGEALVGLKIPSGFSERLLLREPPPLKIYLDGTETNVAFLAKGYLFRSLLQFIKETALKEVKTPRIETRYFLLRNPELKDSFYTVPGVIGAIVSLILIPWAAASFVREKEAGTLASLQVSPITPIEFLVGKAVPLFLLTAGHLVVAFLVGSLWFKIPFLGSFTLLAAASASFILYNIAVGFLAARFSRSQYQAIVTSLFLLGPTLFLSGIINPVESFPPFFRLLSRLNPLYHYVTLSRETLIGGAGWSEGWPWFAALTTASALLAALSLRQARKFFAGS